jgi:hypothetical protein
MVGLRRLPTASRAGLPFELPGFERSTDHPNRSSLGDLFWIALINGAAQIAAVLLSVWPERR